MRKTWCALVCMLAGASFNGSAEAQAIPNAPTIQIGGRINYVATGGSLRTQPDTGDSCAVGSTSSQALSGIPASATIRAAYLYWGGSGTTIDSSVTLNGSPVTASRTFTSTYNNGTSYTFFGGFADVTSRITGNATLTFGGLSVDTGGNYCASSAVLAGWGLVVIYERPATEPYRVINIFDGLQNFRGSALTLTPTGFRIPTSNIDGKITVITWEGDPGNSTPLNGFSESLTFNGSGLDDGIVPTGSDPVIQQFDGTINTLGIATSYGVDVDTYNVTGLIAPGQTNASTVYSAGGDLVLLAAQIVSVTSEPLIDLSITKTHAGNFTVGSNGVFTLRVSNGAGLEPINYPITVTDTLPAGLTYVSAVATGWSCSAVGQTVTCAHPGPLASGASLPDIALTVAVGNAAYPSVANTASVSSPSTVETTTANNSATDTVTVLAPNLSTSTKTVQDLNGGDADPGDTLRYTITVRETAGIAASSVVVTDNIPGNVTAFSVVSIPVGAVNNSTGAGTGSNNNGLLSIGNVSVPANGTVAIVFDVKVAAGAPPGATVDNTAFVDAPAGVDGTPSAPQIIVSASQIPGSGTKQLYLIDGNGLTRTRPGAQNTVTLNEGAANTWTLTQPLRKAVTLNAGTFPVQLYLAQSGNGSNRNIIVTLSNSVLGTIATVGPTTYGLGGTPTLQSVVLNTPAVTAPVGSTFSLTVTNTTTGSGQRQVLVYQLGGASASRVELNSASVINVDSVIAFNAAYPGGTATSDYLRGQSTVYLRAVVSDPFGSFDISAADITLINPSGATVINAQAMTQVADSGTATKTYQYAYAVPANAVAGFWTVRVNAYEGVEGVSDLGVGTFTVTIPLPAVVVSKVSQVLSDPINGATNPKRIPLSLIRYTITVSNTGPGGIDANSLAINDVIPAGTTMYVDGSGGAPVEFIDGATPSGLAFTYASNVSYSNSPGGGAPYTYTPTPDGNGVDNNVTGVRIKPTGTMPGATGGNNPSFVIRFKVRVR